MTTSRRALLAGSLATGLTARLPAAGRTDWHALAGEVRGEMAWA